MLGLYWQLNLVSPLYSWFSTIRNWFVVYIEHRWKHPIRSNEKYLFSAFWSLTLVFSRLHYGAEPQTT